MFPLIHAKHLGTLLFKSLILKTMFKNILNFTWNFYCLLRKVAFACFAINYLV